MLRLDEKQSLACLSSKIELSLFFDKNIEQVEKLS